MQKWFNVHEDIVSFYQPPKNSALLLAKKRRKSFCARLLYKLTQRKERSLPGTKGSKMCVAARKAVERVFFFAHDTLTLRWILSFCKRPIGESKHVSLRYVGSCHLFAYQTDKHVYGTAIELKEGSNLYIYISKTAF